MTTTTSTKTTSAGCLREREREIDRCQAEMYRVTATIEKLVSNDTRCAEKS
jgi:hypothetical protein